MVVAAKYRLTEFVSIQQGTYKQDGSRELIFAKKIVPRAYVEEQNAQQNNVLWIIDEEATLEMIQERERNIVENAKRAEREKLTTADLIEAIAKGNTKAVQVKEEVVKSETPDNTWSKEELQQYLDENDISYSPRHGKAKLIELATKND